MEAEDLDVRFGEFGRESIGGVPGDAVIGAHRIPVGDDEDGGHGTCPGEDI